MYVALFLIFIVNLLVFGLENHQYHCPQDISIHYLIPYENDCTKFYQCSNGEKIEMMCGEGLLFDFDLQICNWPDKTKCESQNITTELISSTKPNESQNDTNATFPDSETPTLILPAYLEHILKEQWKKSQENVHKNKNVINQNIEYVTNHENTQNVDKSIEDNPIKTIDHEFTIPQYTNIGTDYLDNESPIDNYNNDDYYEYNIDLDELPIGYITENPEFNVKSNEIDANTEILHIPELKRHFKLKKIEDSQKIPSVIDLRPIKVTTEENIPKYAKNVDYTSNIAEIPKLFKETETQDDIKTNENLKTTKYAYNNEFIKVPLNSNEVNSTFTKNNGLKITENAPIKKSTTVQHILVIKPTAIERTSLLKVATTEIISSKWFTTFLTPIIQSNIFKEATIQPKTIDYTQIIQPSTTKYTLAIKASTTEYNPKIQASTVKYIELEEPITSYYTQIIQPSMSEYGFSIAKTNTADFTSNFKLDTNEHISTTQSSFTAYFPAEHFKTSGFASKPITTEHSSTVQGDKTKYSQPKQYITEYYRIIQPSTTECIDEFPSTDHTATVQLDTIEFVPTIKLQSTEYRPNLLAVTTKDTASIKASKTEYIQIKEGGTAGSILNVKSSTVEFIPQIKHVTTEIVPIIRANISNYTPIIQPNILENLSILKLSTGEYTSQIKHITTNEYSPTKLFNAAELTSNIQRSTTVDYTSTKQSTSEYKPIIKPSAINYTNLTTEYSPTIKTTSVDNTPNLKPVTTEYSTQKPEITEYNLSLLAKTFENNPNVLAMPNEDAPITSIRTTEFPMLKSYKPTIKTTITTYTPSLTLYTNEHRIKHSKTTSITTVQASTTEYASIVKQTQEYTRIQFPSDDLILPSTTDCVTNIHHTAENTAKLSLATENLKTNAIKTESGVILPKNTQNTTITIPTNTKHNIMPSSAEQIYLKNTIESPPIKVANTSIQPKTTNHKMNPHLATTDKQNESTNNTELSIIRSILKDSILQPSTIHTIPTENYENSGTLEYFLNLNDNNDKNRNNDKRNDENHNNDSVKITIAKDKDIISTNYTKIEHNIYSETEHKNKDPIVTAINNTKLSTSEIQTTTEDTKIYFPTQKPVKSRKNINKTSKITNSDQIPNIQPRFFVINNTSNIDSSKNTEQTSFTTHSIDKKVDLIEDSIVAVIKNHPNAQNGTTDHENEKITTNPQNSQHIGKSQSIDQRIGLTYHENQDINKDKQDQHQEIIKNHNLNNNSSTIEQMKQENHTNHNINANISITEHQSKENSNFFIDKELILNDQTESTETVKNEVNSSHMMSSDCVKAIDPPETILNAVFNGINRNILEWIWSLP